MPSALEVPARTYHITLPVCVSSFTDHAGCTGIVHTATATIKCDCVKCHGDDAVPAAVCPGCKATMPVVVLDNAVRVGDQMRVSRSLARYCEACRAEFLQDLTDSRAVAR